jgi:hypothetical protein
VNRDSKHRTSGRSTILLDGNTILKVEAPGFSVVKEVAENGASAREKRSAWLEIAHIQWLKPATEGARFTTLKPGASTLTERFHLNLRLLDELLEDPVH